MDIETKELDLICKEESKITTNKNFEFMTRKMKRFVEEYVLDYRPKEAAIRAGYQPKYAATIANDLLNKPLIIKYLSEVELLTRERNKVSKDYFITKCKTIVETDDSSYKDKIGALTLLAKITGYLKEKSFESKQVVILQQQGLNEKPVEVIIENEELDK